MGVGTHGSEIPEAKSMAAGTWVVSDAREAMCLGVHAPAKQRQSVTCCRPGGVILPPGFALSQASISWAGMVGEREVMIGQKFASKMFLFGLGNEELFCSVLNTQC